jgi:hypothetical protein
MAMYESDHTQFMREWMQKHPEEKQCQQAGRAMWWGKPQDLEAQQRYAEARVPRAAYAYDSKHD